ncbi:hypothetical protein X772_33280 [Mesorhizobium sp. LSJC280B00]|nr:hypothetical protein X772_33280 [Mesorhizobium sp. LSJC280B00]
MRQGKTRAEIECERRGWAYSMSRKHRDDAANAIAKALIGEARGLGFEASAERHFTFRSVIAFSMSMSLRLSFLTNSAYDQAGVRQSTSCKPRPNQDRGTNGSRFVLRSA